MITTKANLNPATIKNIEKLQIFGILNITEDSFSDGGKYLTEKSAKTHAQKLIDEGADCIDIGAASSHPDAACVSSEIQIERLKLILPTLKAHGITISIDSFDPQVQLFALEQGVSYLNDVNAFSHPEIYPEIASSTCKLVLMHSIHKDGKAIRSSTNPIQIKDEMFSFFQKKLSELQRANISLDRCILDPGMGFFLGSNPETSFYILRHLSELHEEFNLPLFLSVSRKSFLGNTINKPVYERSAATLSAELYAVLQGVAYIRTHEVGQLKDALRIWSHLYECA